MIQIAIDQISDILQPILIEANTEGAQGHIQSISTDAREHQNHSVFIAIKGLRFDGHDYIQQAFDHGAIAAIGEQKNTDNRPYWRVTNSQKALGLLASFAFHQSPTTASKNHRTVIGITGSSGKTTVKEMLMALLAQSHSVHSNQANFNNEIGLPKTLLAWQGQSHVVLEMGARQPNDIAWLCQLARPDIGILTNAQSAHIGIFKNHQAIAQTKGELLQSLDRTGYAVIDGDSPWFDQWQAMTQAQILRVSAIDPNAFVHWQYHGVETRLQANGETIEVSLPLLGRHNALNAALACAAALKCGVRLAECRTALLALSSVPGRLQLHRRSHGVVIDDTYNASPEAFNAAIDVLADQAKVEGTPAMLIMGDMLELGDLNVQMHQAVARYALEKGIDQLCAVGQDSVHATQYFNVHSQNPRQSAVHFPDQKSLFQWVQNQLNTPWTVLIKGSRGMQMEKILQSLLN